MIDILNELSRHMNNDRGKEIKMPIDFESEVDYESSNNFEILDVKKRIKKVKTKSIGVNKNNNNKNSLF